MGSDSDRWIRDFDDEMRRQNRQVCLHLDNFSGHYIGYEPMNINIVFFGPNLTAWVQPLDAGIIRCFKAHYRQRFCGNALERDELGEAEIYKIDLLQVLQMATAAWEDVTPRTIRNCWKHAGIRHNPITIRLPAPTLAQQGWSIILKFASSSDVSLPQAEAELQTLLKNQYDDRDWRPALKLVTECEPDDDVIGVISKLRESTSAAPLPPILDEDSDANPPEYDSVLADLKHSMGMLKKHNRLFDTSLTAEEFVDLDGEEEEEEVKLRTDDEIVEEITRGGTRLSDKEVVDEDDEDSDGEEQITLTEMMDAAMKLERGAPSVGGSSPDLSNLCRKFRLEVQRIMVLEAKQTTLDSFFICTPQ